MTALIDHGARAHSKIGGSVVKRIMACPGSVRLCEQYPSVESEFAAEGTAGHEALDLILSDKLAKDTDVIGLVCNGIQITAEFYDEAVAPCLEQFDKLNEELGGIDYLNEQRVVFPEIEGAFGTVDIVGAAKDRSVILDWKLGRGVAVSAVENEQLMYYAYAAAHTPETKGFFAYDKPIEVFIVQPRVNDGEPFTRWMTTWPQLEVFALELKKAVALSEEADAPFALGPHCKFCSGKIGCPLYQGQVQQIGQLDKATLRAEIEKWLPWADTMATWAKDLKELAHGLLEAGETIPGWKLVNKRATRSWVDEDKALKFMAKAGIPANERYVKKTLSPKQTEDTLKRLRLGGILPDALVKAESSGTTLAPESDSRPAVTLTASTLKALADSLSAR